MKKIFKVFITLLCVIALPNMVNAANLSSDLIYVSGDKAPVGECTNEGCVFSFYFLENYDLTKNTMSGYWDYEYQEERLTTNNSYLTVPSLEGHPHMEGAKIEGNPSKFLAGERIIIWHDGNGVYVHTGTITFMRADNTGEKLIFKEKDAVVNGGTWKRSYDITIEKIGGKTTTTTTTKKTTTTKNNTTSKTTTTTTKLDSKDEPMTLPAKDDIVIEMPSNNKVSKTKLKEAKESKSKLIYENGDKYSWIFDGSKIKDTDYSINMEIELTKDSNGIATPKYAEKLLFLNFKHSGDLPKGTSVKINVSEYWSDIKYLELFYYNEEKDELELVLDNIEAKNGYVELDIKHCSTYVLIEPTLMDDEIVDEDAKEEKSSNSIIYIVIGAVCIIAIATIVFIKIKKK